MKLKIHTVKTEGSDTIRLVRAYTRAGAERYVRDAIKPTVTATVTTQDELEAGLLAGFRIESAADSPQTSIPEPSQQPATTAAQDAGDTPRDEEE